MQRLGQKSSHRHCPHCALEQRKQGLYYTYHDAVEIDYCPRCRGLWFEAGEVSAAQYDEPVDTRCREFQVNLGASSGLSALSCPDCRQTMSSHYLLDEYTMEVASCEQCAGVWLEREQLEDVIHAPKLRQALASSQGEVSWKTWLFQMVSKFPVEYNIKPHITPWLTYGLMMLNIAIFAVMYSHLPTLQFAYESLAVLPAALSQGEQWHSLLSHQFLHGGLMHLLGNMYLLYVVGDNVEDALGHWHFLLAYLLCGVAGALAHYASDMNSMVPMLGASGAISGLFGMYLLWFKHARLTFMVVVYQITLPPWAYFGIWIGFNVIGLVTGSMGVAYWAHIGGFVMGLILGVLLKPQVLKNNKLLAMLHSKSLKV